MRRLRETNNITDCAKIYNDLLGKNTQYFLKIIFPFLFILRVKLSFICSGWKS